METCKIVLVDPSLRYTLHVHGTWSSGETITQCSCFCAGMELMANKFNVIVTSIKKKPYDFLDQRKAEFDQDFDDFKRQISDLHVRAKICMYFYYSLCYFVVFVLTIIRALLRGRLWLYSFTSLLVWLSVSLCHRYSSCSWAVLVLQKNRATNAQRFVYKTL